MNKQRLLTLIEKLKTVPEESFNMRYWWCGTAGCAAGHGCHIPEFKEAGLHISENVSGCQTVRYEDSVSFSALSKFFDIDLGFAIDIFHTYHYYGEITIKDVIKRIELVIEEHELYETEIDNKCDSSPSYQEV